MKRRSFLKGLFLAACLPVAQVLRVPEMEASRHLLSWDHSKAQVNRIVWMLSQQNPILEDMTWKEGNATETYYDEHGELQARLKPNQ